jgi:hypothetical protein
MAGQRGRSGEGVNPGLLGGKNCRLFDSSVSD